jgi:hypothetical protein
MERMNRRNFLKGVAAVAVTGSDVLKSSEAHAMETTLLENGQFNLDAAEMFGFRASQNHDKVTISITWYGGDLAALPLPAEEKRKNMLTKDFEFLKNDTTKIDIRSQIGGVVIRGSMKDGRVRKITVAKDRTHGYFGVQEEIK